MAKSKTGRWGVFVEGSVTPVSRWEGEEEAREAAQVVATRKQKPCRVCYLQPGYPGSSDRWQLARVVRPEPKRRKNPPVAAQFWGSIAEHMKAGHSEDEAVRLALRDRSAGK